jgi:hypothetical protein
VQPQNEQEIKTVATAAAKRRIPLTVRGDGTGNYGQSVPLKGGIVLDMTRYNNITARQNRQHSRAGQGLDPDRAGSLIGNGAAADDVPFNYEVCHDRRLSRWRLRGDWFSSSRHHSRFRYDPIAEDHDAASPPIKLIIPFEA